MANPKHTGGTHKLSSNEVAALVGGLLDMEGEARASSKDVVRKYKFGSDNFSVMGDYYGLRMVNERFCRLARSVFLPFLRMHPRISSFPPEVKSFSHYCDELENFVSMTISRADALRSTQMVVLAPNFVSLLTNAYYGGNISYLPSGRTEFTASENRVIQIVTDGLHRALEAAWRDVVALKFTHPVHEDNLQFATFVESDEQVVCCSFIIQLPDVDPATLDLVYPLQALKPIASHLRSRMQSDQVQDDMRWRHRLHDAVMAVPLNATARLAHSEPALAALNGVKSGRILPVDLRLRPQLLIEGVPLFDAEPGEQAGRAAVSLTRRLGI